LRKTAPSLAATTDTWANKGKVNFMALPNSNKRKIFDGRYEVISIVGRGTDSVVYHARHAASPTQEVALKVLLSQKEKTSVTERLRKEALTLVSCRHRYVVRLDDFHSIGDLCYLSMEYAQAGDLRKYLIQRGAPLDAEIAERFLRQTLEALDFVHATGVIHRDIKPDNILVLNEREIRLADFGLALLPGDEPSIEELQSGVGSFGYLPPEVLEGVRYDQRSDLYSLGLCFYEMLSGKNPFESASMMEQLDIRSDNRVPLLHENNPEIPEHLSSVIAKLMRYDANNRFQSALEALKALNDPDAITSLIDSPGLSKTTTQETISASPQSAALVAEATPAAQESTTPDFIQPFDVVEPIVEPTPSANYSNVANVDEPLEALAETEDAKSSHVFDDTDNEATDSSDATDDSYEGGERISQPTEKIDLERIKEILAKDAKQKSEAASRRALREKPSTTTKARPAPLPTVTLKGKSAGTSTQSRGALSTISGIFTRIPYGMRPVAVGLFTALLTIIVVSAAQILPFGGSENTEAIAPTTDGDASLASSQSSIPSDPSSAGSPFPKLAGGVYAGEIQGVIPGLTSPFSFISLPKQGMLAVIIGIEGWTPVMVSQEIEAVAEEKGQSSTEDAPAMIVVRSNGVILNITGTGSSDIIEGTFANAVTGESGSWKVKKVS
jgi:serine/threonine protein kinase